MRTVEEWIAKSDDAAIPKRVKLRILIRYGGRCYKTGHKFRPGDRIEFDHIKALCLAPAGENWNRESNIAPILGGKVHQAKTASDVKERARADDIQAKHLGITQGKRRSLRKPPGAKYDWKRQRYVVEDGR